MTNTDVAKVRAALDHPVVDADGHVVESFPVVVDYMRRVAGADVAERFASSSPTYFSRSAPLLERADGAPALQVGVPMAAWWALPTNARDRATGFLPRLLHERLDEIGIDYAILYSSVGLACLAHPDDAVRVGACRALNTYLAELLDGLGDRLTSAAVIPTNTPDEAISELEHAVNVLGFKAAMFSSLVPRSLPERGEGATWLDTLALDSPYDYDPLWQRCMDLGVAVTAHSGSQGMGLRASSSRYMYNHIGNFASSADAFAKSLFFGGVTRRFPDLNVAFLECGVSWGVQLLCDLIDRWHKRGGTNIQRLDPELVDAEEWDELMTKYGGPMFADPDVRHAMRKQSDNPPAHVDDFRECGIERAEDIPEHFRRFFFGCEADDATISWAYASDVNPFGTSLQPMLGSDIGHWDVTDVNDVMPEAYELVEDGRLDAEQFRAFACDNVIRLHGGMNPRFFDGTRVEAYARELLATSE
jgi:predicted TIM-barrel fold metal-dependent hydrolase